MKRYYTRIPAPSETHCFREENSRQTAEVSHLQLRFFHLPVVYRHARKHTLTYFPNASHSVRSDFPTYCPEKNYLADYPRLLQPDA